jgi:predicted PurR-regulated permease PerM
MRPSLSSRFAVRHEQSAGRRNPLNEIDSLVATDHPVGAVLSIGMLFIVWTALPVVCPFLIAAIGLGIIFGVVLWVRRRSRGNAASASAGR